MKRVIETIGNIWDELKGPWLFPFLIALTVAGTIVGVIAFEDNTPRPSAEIVDAAWTEWQDMEVFGRKLVCDMYNEADDKGAFFRLMVASDELNDMEAQARMDIMERECE